MTRYHEASGFVNNVVNQSDSCMECIEVCGGAWRCVEVCAEVYRGVHGDA